MKEAAVPKLPQIKRSRRKDNPEARMSIGDHLRELRQRLFVSAAGVMVMTVVGYLVYERAFALITRPIEQANAKGAHLTLNFDTILASFDMKLEVSIWLGILFSSPLWMYEFWAFVGPGMTRKEKAYTWAYGMAGLFLFLAGAGLGIWVMPHAVSILTSFIPDGPTAGVIGANLYLHHAARPGLRDRLPPARAPRRPQYARAHAGKDHAQGLALGHHGHRHFHGHCQPAAGSMVDGLYVRSHCRPVLPGLLHLHQA